MDSDIDHETERLFQMVLDNAEKLLAANPHLFQDLAQGLPYEVLGSGIVERELEKNFGIMLEGLYLKERNLLAQLRSRAGKGTAAYAFLEGIIYYQLNVYSSLRE